MFFTSPNAMATNATKNKNAVELDFISLSEPNAEKKKQRAVVGALRKKSSAFTLFEVLIALAVFAFAIAGLVMALDSMVQALLQTRQRVLSRLELESRLAYNMVDPPISGDRTFTTNGVTFTESMAPVNLTDALGNEINGIYRLKITSEFEKDKDSAEILLYQPQ